jgi:sulfur carrier protein ThiS
VKRDPDALPPGRVRIVFKLYASLAEHLPPGTHGNAMPIEVAAGATVAEVIEPFRLPVKLVKLLLVNGVFVPPAERATYKLAEGDVLAIWPPIAGG